MAEESTESKEDKISPREGRELIAGGDATVIDLSTDEEWGRVGNIPGAKRISEQEVESALEDVDEDRKLVVVCPDGERSANVAETLRENGRDAVSVEGGMAAWADEDLPLQPSEDVALPGDEGSVEDEVSGEVPTAASDGDDEDGDGDDDGDGDGEGEQRQAG